MSNNVEHPYHYNWVEGAECLDIVSDCSFFFGNVIKYLYRWRFKGLYEDLKKALFYIELEKERVENSYRLSKFKAEQKQLLVRWREHERGKEAGDFIRRILMILIVEEEAAQWVLENIGEILSDLIDTSETTNEDQAKEQPARGKDTETSNAELGW